MRIGPGRISATSIGRAAQLQPERVRQPFHRVLGRRVGAAEAQIGETQDRGAVDDPAPAPFPHDAHRPARQLVRSEQVGPEDRLQSLVAEILHRAGQRVGAVVEQRVQRTVAAGQRLGHRGADRGGIGIVEAEALQPLGLQRCAILLAPAGRQNAPAAAMKCPGGIEADAGGTAGDENGLHAADPTPARCRRSMANCRDRRSFAPASVRITPATVSARPRRRPASRSKCLNTSWLF